MKRYFFLILLIIVMFGSTVLAEDFGYGRTENIPINYSNIVINETANMTESWNTDEGVLDNVVDIMGSWITNDLGWITTWLVPSTTNGYLYNDSTHFYFNETTLNNTIESKIASIEYNASNINTIDGTLDSGNLASVLVRGDGDTYNVSEGSGADPLTIVLNFTGVANFNIIQLREWYQGGSEHNIEVGIWLCSGGGYDSHGTLTDMEEFGVTQIDEFVPSDHICGVDQNVSVQIKHTDNGIPSHNFFLDSIHLIRGASVSALTEVDPISIHKSGNTLWTGNDNHSIYNVTANTYFGDGSQLTGIDTGNPFDQSLNTTDDVYFQTLIANTSVGIKYGSPTINGDLYSITAPTYNSTKRANLHLQQESSDYSAIIGYRMAMEAVVNVPVNAKFHFVGSLQRLFPTAIFGGVNNYNSGQSLTSSIAGARIIGIWFPVTQSIQINMTKPYVAIGAYVPTILQTGIEKGDVNALGFSNSYNPRTSDTAFSTLANKFIGGSFNYSTFNSNLPSLRTDGTNAQLSAFRSQAGDTYNNQSGGIRVRGLDLVDYGSASETNADVMAIEVDGGRNKIADYLTIGSNDISGLSDGDINVSTLYYDTLSPKSPVFFESIDEETIFCYYGKYENGSFVLIGSWDSVNKDNIITEKKIINHPKCVEKQTRVTDKREIFSNYKIASSQCIEEDYSFPSLAEYTSGNINCFYDEEKIKNRELFEYNKCLDSQFQDTKIICEIPSR